MVTAAVAYGAFIYLMLPVEVTTLGDDFGYYKSIVETIQHRRPWTDAWLEPWAAALSSLSALVFLTTGSFHAATYGLQAVLAAAGVGMACLLLRERGHALPGAIVTAMLFFTFPTILWKFLEFTGVVLYWPCLLGALLAAEKRRWGWFLVIWGLAVATRQSALAWLIIPGWEIVLGLFAGEKRRSDWKSPALTVLGGAAFFGLMAAFMNKSHAQTVVTSHVFEQLNPVRMATFALVGLLAFVVAAGCGAFMLWLEGRPRQGTAGQIALGAGLIILAAGVLWMYDVRQLVKFEHASFEGRAGWFFILGLCAAAITGWVGGGYHLRFKMLVYALGSLALVSLRADLWDYYLGDILIFGFLGLSAPVEVPPAPVASGHRRQLFRVAASLLIIFCAACNFWGALQFKLRIDRAHATNSMIEHAYREGKVTPHQFYGASFGYIAWHLQPYFMAHEGRQDPKIAHFWNYLLYSIDVRTKYPGWLGTIEPFKNEYPADPTKLITSEVHPVWWVFRAQFTLERATPLPNPLPYVPMRLEEYRRIPYPLNDAEWRELLAKERL
ncbi:MAG: hypothetical protein EXS42_00340 [Lacunisphaera sp.]|nr:hypothetical protein [Lacunisphaera sp.]